VFFESTARLPILPVSTQQEVGSPSRRREVAKESVDLRSEALAEATIVAATEITAVDLRKKALAEDAVSAQSSVRPRIGILSNDNRSSGVCLSFWSDLRFQVVSAQVYHRTAY